MHLARELLVVFLSKAGKYDKMVSFQFAKDCIPVSRYRRSRHRLSVVMLSCPQAMRLGVYGVDNYMIGLSQAQTLCGMLSAQLDEKALWPVLAEKGRARTLQSTLVHGRSCDNQFTIVEFVHVCLVAGLLGHALTEVMHQCVVPLQVGEHVRRMQRILQQCEKLPSAEAIRRTVSPPMAT